jgi:hypothetical protein
MDYSEKLLDPKWQKKRLETLNRDNFTCCFCGDTETELHVHHLKYTGEPYEALLNDLETLCCHCHYLKTFNLGLADGKGFEKAIKKDISLIVLYKNKGVGIVSIRGKTVEHCISFKPNSKILKTIVDFCNIEWDCKL